MVCQKKSNGDKRRHIGLLFVLPQNSLCESGASRSKKSILMKGTEEEKQKHSHSAFPSKRFFLKNSLNRSWWSMRALLVFSGVLVACLTSFSLLTMLSSVSSLRLNKGSSVWRTFGRSNTVWKSLSTLKGGATNSSPLTVDHPSFDRVRDFNVKEFGLQGSIFSHKKSGAQVRVAICNESG